MEDAEEEQRKRENVEMDQYVQRKSTGKPKIRLGTDIEDGSKRFEREGRWRRRMKTTL